MEKKIKNKNKNEKENKKKLSPLFLALTCKVQIQSLDRLQEFRIFYENTKIEQKTSEIGVVSVKI